MREIFFARERWRLAGEGHFTGVFHLFKGGRDLSGTFTSPMAKVNDLKFPDLRGSLQWLPGSFRVTKAPRHSRAAACSSTNGIAPLGRPNQRPRATFRYRVRARRISAVDAAVQVRGDSDCRFAVRPHASRLAAGRFAQRHGSGDLFVTPPEGRPVLRRTCRRRSFRRTRQAQAWDVQRRPADSRRRPAWRRAPLHARSRMDHAVSVDDGHAARPSCRSRERRPTRTLGESVSCHECRAGRQRSRARRHHDDVRGDDHGSPGRRQGESTASCDGVSPAADRGAYSRRSSPRLGRRRGARGAARLVIEDAYAPLRMPRHWRARPIEAEGRSRSAIRARTAARRSTHGSRRHSGRWPTSVTHSCSMTGRSKA